MTSTRNRTQHSTPRKPLRKIATGLTMALCLAGSAALAHDGVKNPVVKARMAAMKTIGENMKLLGGMAKGAIGFDAAAANAALDVIAGKAGEVPALFEAEEDDPKSEARAEIWFDFDDFTAKALALESAASSAEVSDPASLGAALGMVGGACKACHQAYKE